jgi:glycine dehydrogenase
MTDGLPPFAHRHLGPGADEIEAMLAAVGVESLDALVDAAVPASIRQDTRLALPEAGTEDEILARLRAYADRNQVAVSIWLAQGTAAGIHLAADRSAARDPAPVQLRAGRSPEPERGRSRRAAEGGSEHDRAVR